MSQVVLYPDGEKTLPAVQGFSTIVQVLAKSSDRSDILGTEKEAQAVTQQWLEYIVICITHAAVPATAKRILNVRMLYKVQSTYSYIENLYDDRLHSLLII